jgi:aquaporin Z
MNPARALAPAIVSGHLSSLWIYATAPFLGSVIAVPLWMATRAGSGNSAPGKQQALQEVNV